MSGAHYKARYPRHPFQARILSYAATSNSTISGNVATNRGGIGNTCGSLHLANRTIAFNQAFEHGDGVYRRYADYPFDMRSTIVAGNTGATGPEDVWPAGMTVSGSNGLVAAGGVDLSADTLSADPLLAALSANGGPTLTHALGEGSPAIDAGHNDAALEFDQRGEGFVRAYGAGADIGALEVQPVSPPDIILRNGFDPWKQQSNIYMELAHIPETHSPHRATHARALSYRLADL